MYDFRFNPAEIGDTVNATTIAQIFKKSPQVHTNVARYHGTTAVISFFYRTTVPVTSPLRYFLVPQYHKYRGSSARYLSVVGTR